MYWWHRLIAHVKPRPRTGDEGDPWCEHSGQLAESSPGCSVCEGTRRALITLADEMRTKAVTTETWGLVEADAIIRWSRRLEAIADGEP